MQTFFLKSFKKCQVPANSESLKKFQVPAIFRTTQTVVS